MRILLIHQYFSAEPSRVSRRLQFYKTELIPKHGLWKSLRLTVLSQSALPCTLDQVKRANCTSTAGI